MAKKNRRIFVDCQVFQHNTWNRGMGRYTLRLLEALDKESVDLTLILNKNITLDKTRLEAIKKACPLATILYLRLSEDPHKHGGWLGLQETCQTELDKQLGATLKPSDTYLITSNFSIRYCSAFPSLDCKKALIFYDLTPYLQWGDYKNTPDFEPKKYFAQFKTVFMADQLWAISQSAAEEAKHWLGIDESKVENIRGASIRNLDEESTRPKSVPADAEFLLSPSADGPNKNNENMVRAFAEFNAKANSKYKLVITSDFSPQSRDALNAISPDLIFSGHVSDGELGWLYEHCEALLFVSKTEGLGLPILEAVSAGKRVICSDIKVFREISDNAFYLADPFSIPAIADALSEALLLKEGWREKKREYNEIIKTFSWPAAARTCLELVNARRSSANTNKNEPSAMIRYADTDGASLGRDIAEILYAMNPSFTFRSLRDFKYTYEFPSYLIDMNVATSVLDTSAQTPERTIYLIDDSKKSAELLLYALLRSGLIVAVFPKTETPKNIEIYLKEMFDGHVTYKKFIRLLQLAGNHITYAPQFSMRGSKRFIEEVAALDKKAIKGEVR